MSNTPRISSTAAALCGLGVVLSLGLSLGCKQEPLCPELDSCGGDLPIGDWILAPGHPSCSEDLYIPATDTRLFQGDIPISQMPLPEPAVFDWCLLLVTGPGGNGKNVQVKPPRFFYESGPIGAASVRYEANGHFAAGVTRTGRFTLSFPAYCVRAFGAMDNKTLDPVNDPTGPPAPLCKQLELPVYQSGLGEGSYRNTKCDADEINPGGCLCTFEVTETGGPSGHFEQTHPGSNTLLHLPGGNFPQKVTYCVEGDRLQLTGANGAYLFDQRGVRSFDMVRACMSDTDCASGFCFQPDAVNNPDLKYCDKRPPQ